MERKEFLEKFGVGMALICAGCGVASCGSTPKSEDPRPENGNGGTPSNPLFTANLDSEIKEIGTFKIAGGIILVRLAQGNNASAFTAVQLACTHQGVSVVYNNAQGKFICPAHGSEFDNSGAVIKGPAATALKEYNVAVSGNIVSVS
jgi:cytochrome b6-f complex iron-sulfur subunit